MNREYGHDPLVVTFYALKDYECVACEDVVRLRVLTSTAARTTCLRLFVKLRPTFAETTALNAPEANNL
jgi:hypothetical protein